MTQLGQSNDLFEKFRQFRDAIGSAQSVSELTTIKRQLDPYIQKSPEEGGLKLDLRKILENCFKMKEAEIYGESVPTTNINTKEISQDMLPSNPPAPALEGRAKEIAEQMKDIDAENFKTPLPPTAPAEPIQDTAPVQSPTTPATSAPEKKTRSRKPVEESTIEYIPRSQKSVKVFRRINVSINGVAYTNNEVGYEVIADTREEALADSALLREDAIKDIRELNELMKVKPVTQTTPPTPPVAPVKVEVPVQSVPVTPAAIVSAVNDVFPESNFDADKVKKAVAMKSPAGLSVGHEFDLYNLERLRALFTILRSVDSVSVTMPDGSGMMLGAYVTQEAQKFSTQFPIAKP